MGKTKKEKERKEAAKKTIPVWFLWTVIGLLAYASVSNTLVFFSQDLKLVMRLVFVAIAITIIWFLLNLYLSLYFKIKGYETKAWAFSAYYAAINALNLIKIFYHIELNNTFLFVFQIITKLFELWIVIPALLKHYRK